MIFITLGTTKFPFYRLINNLDKMLLKLNLNEELIIQGSNSNKYKMKYKKCKFYREIPFFKEISLLKNARIVIAHGGLATIFLCLKYCKNIPLIVPRNSKFKEHVNNHQITFAKYLQKQGKIENVFYSNSQLSKIESYIINPKKNKHRGKFSYSNSQKQLINKLTEYSESLNN
ncbi:MAG: glycosyltransferase [Patescibacteria group bacterium]